MPGRIVKFHEDKEPYYWNVLTKDVRNSAGELVALKCRNLDIARKKVRIYQGRETA